MVAQADGGRYVFDTGRQALSEMSHLLGVLKTGEESAAFAPAPGVADIAELIAQARQAGTIVSYAVEGAERPVPAGVSLALYRIAQEALSTRTPRCGPVPADSC